MKKIGAKTLKWTALSLAGVILGNASYGYLWPVAMGATQSRAGGAISGAGCGHVESSCRCVRCAGPSQCPCDHGTPSGGSICGAGQDDHPQSAQDTPPPLPTKVMCELPCPPQLGEIWTPRIEPRMNPICPPFAKPIDKVPILPA